MNFSVGDIVMFKDYRSYSDHMAHHGEQGVIIDICDQGALPVTVRWNDRERSCTTLANLTYPAERPAHVPNRKGVRL